VSITYWWIIFLKKAQLLPQEKFSWLLIYLTQEMNLEVTDFSVFTVFFIDYIVMALADLI